MKIFIKEEKVKQMIRKLVLALLIIFIISIPVSADERPLNIKGLPYNYYLSGKYNMDIYGSAEQSSNGPEDICYETDFPEYMFSFRDADGNLCEYRYLGQDYSGRRINNPQFPLSHNYVRGMGAIFWQQTSELDQRNSYLHCRIAENEAEREVFVSSLLEALPFKPIARVGKSIDDFLINPHLYIEILAYPKGGKPGKIAINSGNNAKDRLELSWPDRMRKLMSSFDFAWEIINLDELSFSAGETERDAVLSFNARMQSEHLYNNAFVEMGGEHFPGNIVDEYLQTVYYVEEDVRNWRLRVYVADGEEVYSEVFYANAGRGGIDYTVRVPIHHSLFRENVLNLQGVIEVHYENGEMQTLNLPQINLEREIRKYINDFYLHPDLYMDIWSFSTDCGMANLSVGDIENYSWRISSDIHPLIKEYNSNQPNHLPGYLQDYLRQLRNKIPAPEVSSSYDFTINIQQIINGENENAVEKAFTVHYSYRNPHLPRVYGAGTGIRTTAYLDQPLNVQNNAYKYNVKEEKIYINEQQVSLEEFYSSNFTLESFCPTMQYNEQTLLLRHVISTTDGRDLNFYKQITVKPVKVLPELKISNQPLLGRRFNVSYRPMILPSYSQTPSWKTAYWRYSYNPMTAVERTTTAYGNHFYVDRPGELTVGLVLHGRNGAEETTWKIPVKKYTETALNFNIIPIGSRKMAYVYDFSTEILEMRSAVLELFLINDDGEKGRRVHYYPIHEKPQGELDISVNGPLLARATFEVIGKRHDGSGEYVTLIEERNLAAFSQAPRTWQEILNKPIMPEVDLFVLFDQSVASSTDPSHAVGRFEQILKRLGLDIRVDARDLAPAGTMKDKLVSQYFGTRYPDNYYYSDNIDYKGYLYLDKVFDHGKKETYLETTTQIREKEGQGRITSYAFTNYDQQGRIINSHSPGTLTIPHSDDGYVGVLDKYDVQLVMTNFSYYPDGSVKSKLKEFKGYFSGQVSKEVEVTEEVTYGPVDYSAHYKGQVRKQYDYQATPAEVRKLSDRYVIYYSQSGEINHPEELRRILESTQAELLLIGPEGMRLPGYEFTYLGDSYHSAIERFRVYCTSLYPQNKVMAYPLGTEIKLCKVNSNAESSPIVYKSEQLVHNPSILDNHQGQDIHAEESFAAEKFVPGRVFETLPLSKVGIYELWRQIGDDADRLSFPDKLSVIAHRPPVAECNLLVDYIAADDRHDITVSDNSYDPDYQYSRADRGIRQTRLYLIDEDGVRSGRHGIPDDLPPGEYTVEYYAQDWDFLWSEPYVTPLNVSGKKICKVRISYRLGEREIFSEVLTKEVEKEEKWVLNLEPRDFLPAFEALDGKAKRVELSQENPEALVVFQYREVDSFKDFKVEITSKQLRKNGTIPAGYGFSLEFSHPSLTSASTGEAIWLENKPYTWMFGERYTVSNIYALQWYAGMLQLAINPDSENSLRQIFIPVELPDGKYSVRLKLQGLRVPKWKIDSNGQPEQDGFTMVSRDLSVEVHVQGNIYDKINTIG